MSQEDYFDLFRITGRVLQEVARAKKTSASCFDGWAWNEVQAPPVPWFSGLAILLELVSVLWYLASRSFGCLYIVLILKTNGHSTSLGQKPLSVLPVVYKLWASLWLGHLRGWVEGWLPKSVCSLSNGLSSVEAWWR